MTIDEPLMILDNVLELKQLNHVQEIVFCGAWQGKTYEEIAHSEDYDADYLKVVGAQLWKQLSERLDRRVTKNNFRVVLRQCARDNQPPQKTSPQPLSNTLQDWGEAVDISGFCGRFQELATLEQWITTEDCRLLTIVGMGGMGKTMLSVKLAAQLQGQFEYLIWRSLRNAPPLETILTDLIQFFSRQQETELPELIEHKIDRLMHYVRSSRCLLVLDNVESILGVGDQTGHYPSGYEGYGDLFRRFGETAHSSCLVLASREKPREVVPLEGQGVRSFRLPGLVDAEAQQLLQPKQLTANTATFHNLVQIYGGNPLALKIASVTIQDLFNGDVAEFLDQGTAVFGDISILLSEQCDRLSPLERQIMYWLAINRHGVSINSLAADMMPTVPTRKLIEALESLSRRPLVEKQGSTFTQQPVVMEYVLNHLIDQVQAEILREEGDLLISHALIKANAEDHIRDSQRRMIVQPLLDRLISACYGQTELTHKLGRMLQTLRERFTDTPGYAAGNLLNLLGCLHPQLSDYDFSDLVVRQADLQSVTLHRVKFRNARLEQSALLETLGNVWGVAFSPDGTLIAACDTSRSMHIWRVRDGQKLLTCQGHRDWVCDIAFSSDGQFLISAGGDGMVNLWNVTTGNSLRTLVGHTDWVLAVAAHPDRPIAASSSADQTLRLWDLTSGECLHTLVGHQAWVFGLAFSPDGSQLVSGSDDRTLKLWDVATGTCLKTFEGHARSVRGVNFGPDSQTLVSGSEDGTLRLWDIPGGACRSILTGHLAEVRSVCFSPNGQILISGSYDETIKLWDPKTGNCLRTLQQHQGAIRSVACSPNGVLFVSGSSDQSVRLWYLKTGECCKTLQGYTNFVFSVAFSPDEQTIASASTDYSVSLWDRASGNCFKTLKGHSSWAVAVVFSPDGQRIASSSIDQTIRLWNRQSGECERILRGHTYWIWSVVFSPNHTTLVSGSLDKTIRFWDYQSGECLQILTTQTGVWAVAFSPDGALLASGGEDGAVQLWNPQTGQCLSRLQGHSRRVMSIAFSADGKQLVSASEDHTLRLWQVKTGECLQVFQDSDRAGTVTFCPDGTILGGGVSCLINRWDSRTGTCSQVFEGHQSRMRSVICSADGRLIVSGSEDQTVRLWDGATGQVLQVLQKPRPYDGMDITGVQGITEAQKLTLKALGAVEDLQQIRSDG